MFDGKTLTESQEAEARWRAAFEQLQERMKSDGRSPQTHSGLPIKNAYFPHDIEHLNFEQIGTPGSYPFTRGNLAAQHQLMSWANQPVIGYGLPEHTRERMDYLAAQGMVGYFGSPFYNLVYDLVSHEGLDPDHQGARGRIGQCGMAGQNCYVREEGPEPEIFEISPDVEQIAIERIRELRATRDSARFERAMSNFEVGRQVLREAEGLRVGRRQSDACGHRSGAGGRDDGRDDGSAQVGPDVGSAPLVAEENAVERRIRMLLAKPTQDCHDRGVRYLMRMLRDTASRSSLQTF